MLKKIEEMICKYYGIEIVNETFGNKTYRYSAPAVSFFSAKSAILTNSLREAVSSVIDKKLVTRYYSK